MAQEEPLFHKPSYYLKIPLHKETQGLWKPPAEPVYLSQAYDEQAIEMIYWWAHRRMDQDEGGRIYAILTRLCANFNLLVAQ